MRANAFIATTEPTAIHTRTPIPIDANSAPITVAVVEEEALVRSMMVDYIARQGAYQVVLASAHGAAFVEAAQQCAPPRVVVLALRRGVDERGPCPEVLAWTKEHWPGACVLAITCTRSGSNVLGITRAGACGILCRNTGEAQQLQEALHAICDQGQYVPPDMLRMLATEDPAQNDEELIKTLGRMGRKVLDQVCAPHEPTWKEVAESVHRSEATIDSHATALKEKLGV